MNSDELFEIFRKNDIETGRKALQDFKKEKNKDAFLEPTMRYLRQEGNDVLRAWGATVLEFTGGPAALSALLDLWNEAKDKNMKRGFRFTRFFVMKAIVKIAQTDTDQVKIGEILGRAWEDSDEHYLVRAGASALLALEGRREPLEFIRNLLAKVDEFWPCWAALRALREFPVPAIVDDLVHVMRSSPYIDHRREAILSLGLYPGNLTAARALGDILVTNRVRYLRLTAVHSLSLLHNPVTQPELVNALQDEDAEIRAQSSAALLTFLHREQAVSIVVQEALREETNELALLHLVEALRRLDPDRTCATENLSKELGGQDRRRAEIAERVLIELGGWRAVQRLAAIQ